MTPPHPPDRQQKRQTLRRHGTLNPHPGAVSHPLFHNSDFFDSDDLMQVKYEMLRQVHIDKASISESAQAFGFSRPSFYQAQAALQQDGVKLRNTAAVLPPPSLPKNVQLPRPSAMSRLARSVAPLSMSSSPSSRKRVSASH